jgi:CheY-like chemotaxis protein
MQNPGTIDSDEFERLVRDGLANLFDLTTLQTHPLTRFLAQEIPTARSRAEQLQAVLEQAIEQLKPSDEVLHSGSLEGRPYQILRWRYIDGLRPPEIQARLALSGRQFRRDHGRAVEAVADLLRDRVLGQDSSQRKHVPSREPRTPNAGNPPDEFQETQGGGFALASTSLDLLELIQGVTQTLQQRVQNEGVVLDYHFSESLPPVQADRVILRQILISLVSLAMETSLDERVQIRSVVIPGDVVLQIVFREDGQLTAVEIEGKLLKQALYWAPMIRAKIDWRRNDQEPGSIQLGLSLPRAERQPILLAVDDQEIALRMYRRYLSQTNVRLEGEQDGSQVVEKARTLQPDLILLDVMMPTMDGWEILQVLHAHPTTSHIPVIICSVWEEPELATSLGAVGFLKKPFSQQDFLSVLARFGMS